MAIRSRRGFLLRKVALPALLAVLAAGFGGTASAHDLADRLGDRLRDAAEQWRDHQRSRGLPDYKVVPSWP